jgi:ribonuclease VapC
MIHVMDASALLAVSKGEIGAERVMEILETQDCVISSVNMAEVATRLLDMGLPLQHLERACDQFAIDVIDFNQEQALAAAKLRIATKAAGLSLGDRACLALTQLMQGIAVTADHAWDDVKTALDIKILQIR